MSRQELSTRGGVQVVWALVGGSIAGFEIAGFDIAQDFGPELDTFADDDGVGMLLGFIGQERAWRPPRSTTVPHERNQSARA